VLVKPNLNAVPLPLSLVHVLPNQTCLVKRSRNQFGNRCIATAGPSLWNSLPEQLRQPDTMLTTGCCCLHSQKTELAVPHFADLQIMDLDLSGRNIAQTVCDEVS